MPLEFSGEIAVKVARGMWTTVHASTSEEIFVGDDGEQDLAGSRVCLVLDGRLNWLLCSPGSLLRKGSFILARFFNLAYLSL